MYSFLRKVNDISEKDLLRGKQRSITVFKTQKGIDISKSVK